MAANASWDEITTTTIENRTRSLANNYLGHNPLLEKLNSRGNARLVTGGKTLVEELTYAANSTFKYYSGYEALDLSASDVISAAEYSWTQAAVVVVINGLEMRQNNGKEEMIDLITARVENAEDTMTENLASAVFSDGTTAKAPDGLQVLVAADPTTGTVGGIDRSAQTFWQNKIRDAAFTVSSSNIQGKMNDIWLRQVRGRDRPDMIVGDSTMYLAYLESLQNIQRITKESSAGSGFSSLEFYGTGGSAPVFYDSNVPTSFMYFLNTKFLFWKTHRDANMALLADRTPTNQDAIVKPIIWQGQMTMSNASLQGMLRGDNT